MRTSRADVSRCPALPLPTWQLLEEVSASAPELRGVPPPCTIHRLLEFVPRADSAAAAAADAGAAGGAAGAADAAALSWEGRFARNEQARPRGPHSDCLICACARACLTFSAESP